MCQENHKNKLQLNKRVQHIRDDVPRKSYERATVKQESTAHKRQCAKIIIRASYS